MNDIFADDRGVYTYFDDGSRIDLVSVDPDDATATIKCRLANNDSIEVAIRLGTDKWDHFLNGLGRTIFAAQDRKISMTLDIGEASGVDYEVRASWIRPSTEDGLFIVHGHDVNDPPDIESVITVTVAGLALIFRLLDSKWGSYAPVG